MSEQLLRLDHITMQFGGVVAVDDLELEVNEGEIVALIGPNGAGKTTAFNVITGVYQPTNGAVWFDGAKIIENHPQGKMKKQYKGQLATSLPYGKQRRLEIARALAAEPKLLLLDEPAAGMNPQETEELTAFIGEIREKFKITILLIEHHMNLVMGISDRIYVLDFGKLIAHGTPAEIQKNQRVIDAYLGVADDA